MSTNFAVLEAMWDAAHPTPGANQVFLGFAEEKEEEPDDTPPSLPNSSGQVGGKPVGFDLESRQSSALTDTGCRLSFAFIIVYLLDSFLLHRFG